MTLWTVRAYVRGAVGATAYPSGERDGCALTPLMGEEPANAPSWRGDGWTGRPGASRGGGFCCLQMSFERRLDMRGSF